MDKNAITLGLRIGRILAGQRSKRVPVAYLYGSLRIPFLLEWDEEKYPFAMLYYTNEYTDGSVLYYLLCTEKPMVLMWENYNIYSPQLDAEETPVSGLRCMFRYPNQLPTAENIILAENINGSWVYLDKYVWANYDLYRLNTDTVLLSASEPVPVYE